MSENKIPKCPNCSNQMNAIWYHDPVDGLEEYIKRYKIYYRGIENKNEDRESPERIVYHCYNCNRSYSRNLKIYVEENDSEQKLTYAKKELNRLINEIAKSVVNEIDDDTKNKLREKPEYSHFGFGLYIRNNFIHNNDKIKYRLDADNLANKVYDRILEILSSQ